MENPAGENDVGYCTCCSKHRYIRLRLHQAVSMREAPTYRDGHWKWMELIDIRRSITQQARWSTIMEVC